MIPSYLVEPLVKNYTAPKYPLFIALQNSLASINNKKSLRDPKHDIQSYAQKIGPEGQKFVLVWLLEAIDLPEFKQKNVSHPKIGLFIELIKEYASRQPFLSYFPDIINKVSRQGNLQTLIQNLCQNLKLPTSTIIAISLSLYLSDRAEFIQQGQIQLIKELKYAVKNNKGQQFDKRMLQQLIFQINRSPELSLKLDEQYNYLLQIAQKDSQEQINTKLYNFQKCDWQHFVNQTYSTQKPGQSFFKKVDYIKQLGPYISFQPEILKNALSENGILTEDDIFQCLVMMTDDQSKSDTGIQRFICQFMYSNKKNNKSQDAKKLLSSEFNSKKINGIWNVDNFINVCNQTCPNLKWQNVFSLFDRPKLHIASQDHFLSLMKAFQKTKKIGQKWKIPENLYLKKWNNPHSQALFLIHIFTCKDPDLLFLGQIQNKKIQKTVRDCNSMQKQIWGHIDLVQILIQVSDYRFISIRELFQGPITKYPELLLLTLSQTRPSKGQALLDQLFSSLLPQYFQNHSTNVKLLDSLWQNNQDLVISSICEIYKSQSKKQNSFNLSRVLDITQSIKDSLIPFTTWNDYEFSIPLAVIAGKREFLNFQPWIVDRIQKLSNSFVKAILLYIDNYLLKNIKTIAHPSHKQSMLQKAQLTIQLLNKIFYTIMSKLKREQISYRNFQLLKKVFKQCCQNFPEITDNQIPDQIQRETERQINRIYKQQISIKDAIQRMKKLKNSLKQQDQQQFASHITFLCTQLSYHHTYPEKQLMITAQLFAALINANLIQSKIYTMFLNVLEGGLKQENQKYMFSLKVIDKIKPKLSQQAWFCQKLIDNELLMKRNPQIVQQLIKSLNPPKTIPIQKLRKIKQAIQLKNAPVQQPVISVVIQPQQQIQTQISLKKTEQNDYEILNSLDITKKIEIADKQTKLSKINITCNTLSMNNVEQKSKDLRKIIEGDKNATNLLAYNIVFKRISTTTQNNGIQIIYRLVERLPMLQKPVLNITYQILKQWFALKTKSVNDKKLSNFKNIGSWLGKLTIGKGMPIPIHHLNIRRVLIQSFSNLNRLSFNIPVIIKILQHIHSHPDIFRTTSPWLSRIVGTLSQIQQKIKQEQFSSTKSQIKAFFKSTNIKLENVPSAQTSYLTNNNNHNSNRIVISELDKFIKMDQQSINKYLPMGIDLKMIITKAVDDSIQQIVQPVIDRAVKIAKVTTIKLISKDFAYEPDPQKFRESSYKLVKQMAGPLAQVTCRQPLKASMNRSLKNMLQASITDLNQMDNIIQKAIADNLDLGCTLIKQAVVESAQEVIKKDSFIHQALQLRFSAQIQGIMFKSQFEIPAIVPQELRPRPGGLSLQQYQVYSQFKKQKNFFTEKVEQRSNVQKIIQLIVEKGSIKTIKQLFHSQYSSKDQILTKLHQLFAIQTNQQPDIEYYLDVCDSIKDQIDVKQTWKSFKQHNDIKKKQSQRIIRRLVRDKYFPEAALNELDKSSEQQNKVTTLFESWLETAHQGIQPFLRNLQQMFNKSQNQIKIFFSCSLFYAMQKVAQSYSQMHESYDTNYIENYTKLIIISYKTIASNNCSLYLEHTIQAILDVFNKLHNSNNNGEFSYQRPFFKLFTNLICDVTRKQYDIDHEKVLTFYCVLAKQLQKISPLSSPNFTCAWVELICNKNFMPALLMRYQYWDLYYHLLASLFKFVRQYITEQNLNKKDNQPYQNFYLGVMKLIIVILHDFPDFLSQFSIQLANLAGSKFYQLNSIIISSFPRQMKFETPLKVDKRQDFVTQCKKGGMPKYYKVKFDKPLLNYYLQNDPRDAAYKEKLAKQQEQTLQILALYATYTSQNQINQPEALKRFTQIIVNCHDQTRQKLLSCVLNLIRYPNNVTLFYIDLVKDLIFTKQVKDNSIRQQILSCVIARMNSQGPHTWGQIYLVRQLQIHKNQLFALNISHKLLETF